MDTNVLLNLERGCQMKSQAGEPPRLSWRLQHLREWSHEEITTIERSLYQYLLSKAAGSWDWRILPAEVAVGKGGPVLSYLSWQITLVLLPTMEATFSPATSLGYFLIMMQFISLLAFAFYQELIILSNGILIRLEA